MRTSILALLTLGLMAGPAMAENPPPNPPTRRGTLQVTNACDEAVVVSLGSATRVLEPNESVSRIFTVGKGKTDVSVVASLVPDPDSSDPPVTAESVCEVQANKTTRATVTCSTTAAGVSLAIVCDRPARQASLGRSRTSHVALASAGGFKTLARESGVLACSGGGLMALLVLGTLLGRAPRRRKSPGAIAASAGDHV